MEHPPPPPALERQTACLLGPITTRWKPLYDKAMSYWHNASKVFPEFFQGDLVILAIRVTPQVLNDMEVHDPDAIQIHRLYDFLRIGDFVGKVTRHVNTDRVVPYPGDILYTTMSYHSYGAALDEACLLSIDATRAVVRHILHIMLPLDQLPSNLTIDKMADCVLTRGLYPSETNVQDDLDSDREPEWSLHLPE